jgi:uncharacterized protein YijF (DUF1287 family)
MPQTITVLTEGHAHDVVLRAYRASQLTHLQREAAEETPPVQKRPEPWIVRGFPVIRCDC